MATYESDTLIQTKDANGNIIIHYPITMGQNILLSDEARAALGITDDGATMEDGFSAVLVFAAEAAVPNFDNPLAWPGCTRVTPPMDESTATIVEQWVDSATKQIKKAQRTTVKNEDGSYLETYEFYKEDGTTLKQKFTVLTSKDGETETYYEEVTEVAE